MKNKSDAANYRPVALTSVPCKVLESLIRTKLVQHIEKNKLFSDHQHGFMKNRSCLTNLLETFEEWTSALDAGYGLDVLYLDYQKAFDTVPHQRLMVKLKWYGVDKSLLRWISEFVGRREMRVVVGGVGLYWGPVSSGIPQGSILGPLLFVLYVNELPSLMKSRVKLFADDTKLWRSIKSNQDAQLLQDDVSTLIEWSGDWLLKLSIDKCKKLSVGNTPFSEYYIEEGSIRTTIQAVREEKDLGIFVSEDLKWSLQCGKVASKAMMALGLIKRTFPCLNKELFLTLYSTYVRPHMEFCVQAWSPYLQKDIATLERIQRRATKLVKCISKLSYQDRLRYLGLYSLERRRKRGDLIETFKILSKIDDTDPDLFFELSRTTHLRGHSMKLFKKRDHPLQLEGIFSVNGLSTTGMVYRRRLSRRPLWTPSKDVWTSTWTAGDMGNKSCRLNSAHQHMMMMMMKQTQSSKAPSQDDYSI
jgi:hypothetical protein